ncbi:MAG: hypothetical protein JOZ57_04240 [Abitibacteriaceae bacterium]|nr:hypothetical protein [Abditibacteriaceae bacterium]
MLRTRLNVWGGLALVLLGTALSQCPGWSWGDGGHMIVASIAYQRLNPHAKAESDRLLQIPIEPQAVTNKSLDFIHASYWPDEVRRLPGFEFSGDLHFVDVPFSPDGTPILDDILKPDNVVFALIRYVGTLQNS